MRGCFAAAYDEGGRRDCTEVDGMQVASCGPQKLPEGPQFRSRGHRLKTILVVQAADDRLGDDTVDGEDPMAAGRSCETIG